MSDEKQTATYQIGHVAAGGTVANTIESQHVTVNNHGVESTLRDYYRQLARECQLHTLADVQEDGGADNVYAEDIYVQPDVLIAEDERAVDRSTASKGEPSEAKEQSRRVPLHDCLTSSDPAMQRLVLTAPSGFGKSTAINMRLQALVKAETAFLMLRLPSLRASSHQSGVTPRNRVEVALARDIAAKLGGASGDEKRLARVLVDKLDAAPGVMLFDALDEVPQGERDDVVACVRNFLSERAREQNAHRVLITSRPYAYTGQFEKDDFKRIELAEFTSEQQDELIDKWFRQHDKLPATGSALTRQLQVARSSASPDAIGLAKLMTEPMLLTYACMLAEGRAAANADAPLPPTRYELFDGVVSLMLEKWDPKRNNSDVARFQELFRTDGNSRSILRQCLEHAALQELQGLEGLLVRYQSDTLVVPKGFVGSLTQERLVHWLDDAMPDDLPVRARTVLKWLAQRSGLLYAAAAPDGLRYVLHAQLRDFLAAGALQSKVQSANEFVRAAVALLGRQPQWYRPMMSAVLARLRDDPQALVHAVEQVLGPPVREPGAGDPIVISAKNESTPDFVTLHFVIAWANAFGEAGPSGGSDHALKSALQTLRERCVQLVTAPAEGKPPIQLRAEAADALGLIGDPRFDPMRWHLPSRRTLPEADEPIPGFVRIAAGEFVMGDEREKNNSRRKFRIEHPFYIARYATTVAQFRHFVDDNGYGNSEWWGDEGLLWLSGEYDEQVQDAELRRRLRGRRPQKRRAPGSWSHQLQSPSRPVVFVTWFESRAYARWLQSKLGSSLAAAGLSTHTVTLPTEPQWERAARWADNTAGYDERRWPWGDDKALAARFANVGRILAHASSVGLFEPTGPALFDMAGNAWEWMANGYHPGKGERFAPVRRVAPDEPLTLRGGSWIYGLENAGCSYRGRYLPVNSDGSMGLRVVLSLAQNES